MRGLLVAMLLGVAACNHGSALAPGAPDGGADLAVAASLDLGLCGDAPPLCPAARPADGEPCCPRGPAVYCTFCDPPPPMACSCVANHWRCSEVSIQCPPPDLG
jgi:hypothetical protein